MNRKAAVLCTLLSLPFAASAQEGLGLDLSDDAQNSNPQEPQETKPAPAQTDSLSTGTAPAPTDAASKTAAAGAFTGERDITQEDRVKSVQRKVYLKKHRFELNPFIGTTINDPYYPKVTFAGRLAYHLADSMALSTRATLYSVNASDDAPRAKTSFQSRLYYSSPEWSVMGDFEWSPLYGKTAFYNSILHMDGYVIAGLGVIRTETSALPDRGLNPAADLGIGLRFVAKDFLAVNASLINTSYLDQPKGTTKGLTQNIMTVNAGVSIFFPFRSTGRESE